MKTNMAEGGVKSQETSVSSFDSNATIECAICLQTCVHPAELPCGHIFCFLCIKGIAFQSGRCAMCREAIPLEFLYKPRLVTPLELDGSEDTYNWYYEGYSGWWQYDQRANAEIEEAFQKEEKSCQLLLAGSLYVIDFNAMIQYRQANPARRRRIKRDIATTDRLGVAGLRTGVETDNNEGDSNTTQAAQALLRTIGEVEIGLHRLRLQASDELDSLQRQSGEVQQHMQNSFSVVPTFHSGADTFGSTSNRFSIQRQDSEQQGLESLGPEEYPSDFSFRAISPIPRDGRTFNPRLELGDGGDDDTDENDEEDVEEGPTRIFSGPCTVSSAAFRPLPMRARGQESSENDLEASENN